MSETNGNDNLSKAEIAKIDGNYLRGTIEDVLADQEQSHFKENDLIQLKFHGVYQQDDRDVRRDRVKAGLEKAFSMMIRIGPPGGECTAEQYLAMDRLCDSHANGTLRLTNRQAFQFHGVLKGNLKETMAEIQRATMTSLAACGDIPRNFLAPPATFKTPAYEKAQGIARFMKQDLAPATGAYVQIWLDGEKVVNSDDAGGEEPFYGEKYLPRKFKVAVGLDVDNSVDVYANDCGLIGITNDAGDDIVGWNLTVGGGFGMTHNKADTIARIASPIGFVPEEHGAEAVRTVVAIFRDHGNRENRRAARIKYLLEEWGVEKFRAELQSRVSWTLGQPREVRPPIQLDHMGLHDQGDGKQFYGVFVENGRIADANGRNYKAAFRTIVEELNCPVRLTAMQSIIFADLEPGQADRVVEILRDNGIPVINEISRVRRFSMACPALPTCGLAMSDSERIMPEVVDMLEEELEAQGLADLDLTVRMTGCPNGCGRPYNADIGFVGRKPGVYHVYVGGGLTGDRIADLYAADVKIEDAVQTLRPLFQAFKHARSNGESLSDFYQKCMGRTERRPFVTGKETPTIDTIKLTVNGN